MIFFSNADGTITKSFPSAVYQGSDSANDIILIAPFSSSTKVAVSFVLPDGVIESPHILEPINGQAVSDNMSAWKASLPFSVAKKYGTVTVQFAFYFAGGIRTTSSSSFMVGRGVSSAELPTEPEKGIYEDILEHISAIESDLKNGYFPTRAVFAWCEGMPGGYGANELVYYNENGKEVYLKSLASENNVNPYNAEGELNENWQLVFDFAVNYSALEKILNGTTVVPKAEQDSKGRNIAETFDKKLDKSDFNYAKNYSFVEQFSYVYPSKSSTGTFDYAITEKSFSFTTTAENTAKVSYVFKSNNYLPFDKDKVLIADCLCKKANVNLYYKLYDKNLNELTTTNAKINLDKVLVITTSNENVKFITIDKFYDESGAASSEFKISNLQIKNKIKPTILFNFDNGDIYDNRAEILEANGFRGTFCSQSHTVKGIKQFVEKGHDIALYGAGGHVGPNPSSITSEEWYEYIKAGRDAIAELGYYYPTLFGCTTHKASTNIIKYAKELGFKYISCATIYGNDAGTRIEYPSNSKNQVDNPALYPQGINNMSENYETVIQEAIDKKQVLSLFTHLVEDTPTQSYNTSTELFTKVVECVKRHYDNGEVDVLTMREFYNKYHPQDGQNLDFTRGMSLSFDNTDAIPSIDVELSDISENPVQNKVITEALDNKVNKITVSASGKREVYGITADGEQITYPLEAEPSDNGVQGRVPLYTSYGGIRLAKSIGGSDAVRKDYVDSKISTVTEIAEGKTKTYVVSYEENPQFNSQEDVVMNSIDTQLIDINGIIIPYSDLKQGDIILITETDVPDRWVWYVPEGGAYTEFGKLETAKVDLEPYALKESVNGKLDKPSVSDTYKKIVTYNPVTGESGAVGYGAIATTGNIPIYTTNSRLRVGEATESDDAVNVGWLSSSKAKSINGSRIRGGWVDTHPEENPAVISYFMNDLAYLFDKGGSCAVTGTTVSSATLRAWFDGTPSYGGFSVKAVTDTVVILVKSPKTYDHASRFGIGFGSALWGAKDVKIEVGYSGTIGGDPTDDMWKTVLEVTGSSLPIQTTSGNGPGTNGAWNAIRITLTNFNITTPRIADIWAMNYESQSLATTLLPRKGGKIYGNLEVTGTTTVKKPTADNHAATKGYVDEKIAAIPTGGTAPNIKVIAVEDWYQSYEYTYGQGLFRKIQESEENPVVCRMGEGVRDDHYSSYVTIDRVYNAEEDYYNAAWGSTDGMLIYPTWRCDSIVYPNEDGPGLDYAYKTFVPTGAEFYSSSKNIIGLFGHTGYESPGNLAPIFKVTGFSYIKIACSPISSYEYELVIISDGVIEEIEYDEQDDGVDLPVIPI